MERKDFLKIYNIKDGEFVLSDFMENENISSLDLKIKEELISIFENFENTKETHGIVTENYFPLKDFLKNVDVK